MAHGKSSGRLEEALAILIQYQAAFVPRMADIDAREAETNRLNSKRFARIEALLLEHTRILLDHSRILEALPEAVREKFGFKPTGV